MNSAQIRQGVTARLGEARNLLASVRNLEQVASQRNFSGILKGHIYVSLYATLEYCVTQSTESFLNEISSLNVQTAHLEYVVSVVALDTQLNSAKDSGGKNKWTSRRAIFDQFSTNTLCQIPDNVFGTFLHNIWPKTIQEVFHCLAINKPATSDPREIGYLKEIVEKRNEIAHGRTTAEDAAQGITTSDMQIRLDAIYSACQYFIDTLEQHANEKRYIRPRYRRNY